MFQALIGALKRKPIAGESRAPLRMRLTLGAKQAPADSSLERRRRLGEFLTEMGNGAHVPCSSLKWRLVEPFYKPIMVEDTNLLPPSDMDAESFSEMLADIDKIVKAEGSMFEPDRLALSKSLAVHAVLDNVTKMFGNEFRLTKEGAIKPAKLHVTSRADYVLQYHRRAVIVVDVKRFDILQGQTQVLLMLDAANAASIDRGDPIEAIWGIASTYDRWVFYQYTPATDSIVWTQANISRLNHREDAVQVARRLHTLLLAIKAER
jgi:hypothetical protein